MPDRDDILAAPLHRCSEVLRLGSGRKSVVRLALGSKAASQLVSGLARTEERARQDCVCLHSLLAEAMPERARLLAALGRQRPQLVRLTRRGLRMTHEVEAHQARE